MDSQGSHTSEDILYIRKFTINKRIKKEARRHQRFFWDQKKYIYIFNIPGEVWDAITFAKQKQKNMKTIEEKIKEQFKIKYVVTKISN